MSAIFTRAIMHIASMVVLFWLMHVSGAQMRHSRMCAEEAPGVWVRMASASPAHSPLPCPGPFLPAVACIRCCALMSNTAASCRSAFAEDFRDAKGFGWDPSTPPHNLKELIKKKVAPISVL